MGGVRISFDPKTGFQESKIFTSKEYLKLWKTRYAIIDPLNRSQETNARDGGASELVVADVQPGNGTTGIRYYILDNKSLKKLQLEAKKEDLWITAEADDQLLPP
eukprot:jgi/Bigna1/130395/aug1.11_g5103